MAKAAIRQHACWNAASRMRLVLKELDVFNDFFFALEVESE
jgi:hypothetical protein